MITLIQLSVWFGALPHLRCAVVFGSFLSRCEAPSLLGSWTCVAQKMLCTSTPTLPQKSYRWLKTLLRPTTETWKKVAQRFWGKWNVPNCLGALDGKCGHSSPTSIYRMSWWEMEHSYLMRPYPRQNLNHRKSIFKYRLSRARIVVENVFGILLVRWWIFHRRITLHPNNVDRVVVAACILHIFLLAPSENVQQLDKAGESGVHMAPVRNMGGNRAPREACALRDSLATFFTSPEGSVSWQDQML
uniref:DDE Tnp4 domain-containing protein n=1 Tax=Gouania willdenowi TaxID=441366 RepID=A0A8C5H0P0_GOUWI